MRKDIGFFKKRLDRLSGLIEASAVVNSTLDLNRLLTVVMQIAKKVMRAEASSLMLIDEAEKVLVYEVALGEKGRKVKERFRLKLGQGIAGWVAKYERPLLVKDVRSDRRFFPSVDKATGFKTRSILCVPMKAKQKTIGIIEAINPTKGRSFENEDVELFSAFANQAAIAIENARAYEDLKNTQAQLLHEEKLATIGRMANAIGHEINNPLSILFMNLQTLERDLRERKKLSPDMISERLEKANRQAQRINVVVEELTHLFRETERGIRGALDLKDLIKESRSLVRYQSGLGESLDKIEIVQDVPKDLPKVRGDSNQLQQVFLNLFTNACQAMGAKGKIIVSAQVSPEDPGFVTIRFSDNGPGISREFLNKIFDYRFTTREKGKGTGMGLFVVRYIMTLHEGSISVESEPDKGTTFTLKLPTIL